MGVPVLILNTSYFVKIFPGCLHFEDLDSKKSFKTYFKFHGPQKNFTIIQNLRNGVIDVFFHSLDGFISYSILIKENKVFLYFKKLPSIGMEYEFDKIKKIYFSKEEISLPIEKVFSTYAEEYLSFGIFKKQELFFIKRREDIKEILPILFLCSQFYLDNEAKYPKESSLLEKLEDKILKKDKKNLEEIFLSIIKAHFFGAFVPTLNDFFYQNIIEDVKTNASVFFILQQLFKSIKSMLVFEKEDEVDILPCLLPVFHHGKAVNLKLSFGLIDIEFSKKLLKKVILKPTTEVKKKVVIQKKLFQFRLRTSKKDRGRIYKNNDVISFEKGKVYFFDRFQK